MEPIDPLKPWQAWELGPEYPRWSERLHDGTQIVIRPLQRTDAPAELAFIQAMSPEARRFRFLGQIGDPSEALIEQLTNLDYEHDLAFAAVVRHDGKDIFVGVSRYSMSADGSNCECAVTVLDEWQHKGLGVLLMKHLIEVAKGRGIKRMWSLDSAENTAMSDLARFLGFERAIDPNDASQVVHSLWLG